MREPTFYLTDSGKHVVWEHDCLVTWTLKPLWQETIRESVMLPINAEHGWQIVGAEPHSMSPCSRAPPSPGAATVGWRLCTRARDARPTASSQTAAGSPSSARRRPPPERMRKRWGPSCATARGEGTTIAR